MDIIVGGNDLVIPNENWFNVVEFITHHLYSPDGPDFDITLIRLSAIFISTARRLVRTIGGQIAAPWQIPYFATLIKEEEQSCGGSLISQTMVLTAAHCTLGAHPSQMDVIVGTNDLSVPSENRFSVAQFIRHPLHSPYSVDFDIALVRLSKPVPLGPLVQTILLADADSEYPEGETATISGFGAINHHRDRQSFLRYAEVPIWSEKECRNKKYPFITERNICAGTSAGIVSSCYGDSGGPLTVDNKLYGVVSWGYKCGRTGPGVYSYVPAYRCWIFQNAHI
ncbi:uncharacterized protein Dwil_GK28114 [Drosophila willistoni]|uniref:Peptidase S1 domain-containing protein n=2 Tax=Drosophila willistoni TaxID=7260 RepID=A0A0Q9X0P8_DROWI|nr:uncharacterized protein Dwil_GK28114 [Drosophila willistoni]